jgi:hypothetical protein
MFVTSDGSARTRFRRALAAGDPQLVMATARDVERITVSEAFAICLVLAREGDPRAQSAWRRLVERAAAEHSAAQALRHRLRPEIGPLLRGDAEAARRAAALLEKAGFRGAAREVEERLAADDRDR